MDFQTALANGYYFDRCIDLKFYDGDGKFLGRLDTPKRGMKPSIVIKGSLIEGSYDIDTYISVQNMSYDINIMNIETIEAHMYYSGLSELEVLTENSNILKGGHTVIFSVLYADQEKEPPHRAVRFQCVVAAQDSTRYQIPLIVDKGEIKSGTKVYTTEEGQSTDDNLSNVKSSSIVELKTALFSLAKIYNDFNKQNIDNKNLREKIYITAVQIDDGLETEKVIISDTSEQGGTKQFGDLIREINTFAKDSTVDAPEGAYKVYVMGGSLCARRIPPKNWIQIAKSNGITSNQDLEDYYNSKYNNVQTNVYKVNRDGSTQSTSSAFDTNVDLNFVKGATRSENIITATTLFDDRIYPGCYCRIRGNSIMGKQFGGRRSGGRLLIYTDSEVVFRATGSIEYEFSTTEDNYMTITGPVIYEKDVSKR